MGGAITGDEKKMMEEYVSVAEWLARLTAV